MQAIACPFFFFFFFALGLISVLLFVLLLHSQCRVPLTSGLWSVDTAAVQLNTGKGCHLDARGIHDALHELPPLPGGVLFIGASADETIRAFDKDTGKILWSAPLPFSGNATPSTYAIGGRQFVVISAGGGKSGRPAGGSIVAFALPKP